MTDCEPDCIDYRRRTAQDISDQELSECASLFSNQYGTWSLESDNPGEPIRFSANRLKELISVPDSSVFLAYSHAQLVGHAFLVRKLITGYGVVSWVTQLVVHNEFRRRQIATRLLNASWAYSNDFAWGLVTANPFTVRALEHATSRRCVPRTISSNLAVLKEAAASVKYVAKADFRVDNKRSIVNTKFFIDHSTLPAMLKQAIPPIWRLGRLGEGEEWLAFTFREQKRKKLTFSELQDICSRSEQILLEAYSRMSLDAQHRWASHTESEIDFILNKLQLQESTNVIDFGCGTGRHSFALAKRGHKVTGIDFIKSFIKAAQKNVEEKSLTNVEFVSGDCRTANLNQQFELGICLYDVIGSYADPADNEQLILNLVRHIKPGGYVVISVMNMELTKSCALYKGNVQQNPELLQKLEPSGTMQSTGNVFDPKHYLLDTVHGVVYRKEQFGQDGQLSTELIVRDRRYSTNELSQMCGSAGLQEIACSYVQSGKWGVELSSVDRNAKAVLYFGKKLSESC